MDNNSHHSLSPLDGRYARTTQPLANIFSEFSLVSHRIQLEIQYFQALSKVKVIRPFTKKEVAFLNQLQKPTQQSFDRVKEIEQKTHHDVKAVEYYLAKSFQSTSLEDCIPFLHLGLTSEDINNLSYRLMVMQATGQVIQPQLEIILGLLANFAQTYSQLPMLARTHGQAAIPTTLGKEISVFAIRLLTQLQKIDDYQLSGKFNGAVGSFQALSFIQPKFDWIKFSKDFVTSLGLQPNLHTTQINPADDLIGLLHIFHLVNSILIDLDQDLWRYISDDWLVQTGKDKRVGSSTMPQKINPIEFENSEGNLTLANGLIETVNRKLPISRLQRDLSDSTINRNLGSIFGYCSIGYQSLQRGLETIKPNLAQIEIDLNRNYSILGEALQTQMRYQKIPQAYEQVATQFKHKVFTQADWQQLTQSINPELATLTPASYTGLAQQLTQLAVKDVQKYLKRKVK